MHPSIPVSESKSSLYSVTENTLLGHDHLNA